MVILVDFEDSFTFNISASLHLAIGDHKILQWKEWLEQGLPGDLIILGPGPGHIREYIKVTEKLALLLEDSTKFIMGICLGHQLIWRSLGANITRRENPTHGQSLTLGDDFFFFFENFDDRWNPVYKYRVQYYNSWSVDTEFYCNEGELFKGDGMVIAGKGKNFLSYQFHPESVGTTCPEFFFAPLKTILDKIRPNEVSNRRYLRQANY